MTPSYLIYTKDFYLRSEKKTLKGYTRIFTVSDSQEARRSTINEWKDDVLRHDRRGWPGVRRDKGH